jgi:DNA polymerase III delta prime subunit
MDQLVKQKSAPEEKSGSWASLLDKKGFSPPKTKFASSSTSSGATTANGAGEVLKSPVTLNPYAPAPGEAVHPFFMSSEARRTHAIKDNQQKLQSALAKRQEEIRSQQKPGSISAFFAPRTKSIPATTSSSPINLELRSGFVNYGSNLPDFPQLAHVMPPSSIPSSFWDVSIALSLESLELPEENIMDATKEPIDFSGLASRYQLHYGLNYHCSLEGEEISEPLVQPQGDKISVDAETIRNVALQLEQTHLAIRRSLGMNTTIEPELNRSKSAVEQVPLLDVKAEDMAAHLALQQQAVAQRQVAEEEALIAATFFNPPYLAADLEDLYRVMAKQRETSPALPWVSCYAPTKASHVCGNRHVALQMKDWLIRWQSAVDVLEAETPKGNDFFKKRAPVKVVETVNPLESLANTVVLTGPTGCGKTAAVYAVANELGFEVLEVNASNKRTGASLRTMIEEATLSRHLGRASSTLTILLFEEVDQQFDEDAGFFNALISICESAKRPIILTCQELPRVLASKLPKLAVKEMKKPDEAAIFVHAALACLISGYSLPTTSLIHQFAVWFNYDFRAILHNLQYWASVLHSRHWSSGVCALACIPLPRDTLTSTSHSDTDRVFSKSESEDLPHALDLFHHHYLASLANRESNRPLKVPLNHVATSQERHMEIALSSTPTVAVLDLISSAAQLSDSLSLLDSWKYHASRQFEFDTQHVLGDEISAYLQHVARQAGQDWLLCYEDESLYTLGQKTQQAATEALVTEVSQAMIVKSGSRLSRFEDCVGLALIASMEDQQRLLNVRRRQYKSKVDWSRIKPAQRLLFIRSMRLPDIPSPP